MRRIIDPIDKNLIKSELTQDKLMRRLIKLTMSFIYLHHDSNLMLELAVYVRLHFRYYGGGTGKQI